MNRTQDVTAAFVLGAVAGGVAVLLLAPEKGETTRKHLRDGAAKLVKRGGDFVGTLRGAAVEAVEAARHEAHKQGQRLTGNGEGALLGSEHAAP